MRVRIYLSMAAVLASVAAAQPVSFVGDLVVVQDPAGDLTALVGALGAVIPSPQEQFCRAAYNAARDGGLSDEFDGVFVFSTSETWSDVSNLWQGAVVRADGTGYGRTPSAWAGTYDSGRLGQCVFMGTLGRTVGLVPGLPGTEPLPADPDGDWVPSLGLPFPGGVTSLTGVEMLGHEYGHHWLLGIEFDQADGRGPQHFIRGYEGQYGNQHYSDLADSRSVMYGECITDLDGGAFELRGCERKYSQLDQYLMGLRAPGEVAPMMVLEDPRAPGSGVDSIAMGRSAPPRTITGLTRHDITIDEVLAAMGSRVPAHPSARRCWRVAFVVVLAPGQTAVPQAMLDKVSRYRERWGPWFHFATDGRGSMDVRLAGSGCLAVDPDGGVALVLPADAGAAPGDAGQPEPDAGLAPADGGLADLPDAGPGKWDTYVPLPNATIRPGCGCTGAWGGELLLAALALLARRRR